MSANGGGGDYVEAAHRADPGDLRTLRISSPHPFLEQQATTESKHYGDGCHIIEMPDPSDSPPAKKRRKNIIMDLPSNMDHTIWKDLPEDLFEPVIARLPIPSFFRLRSVCRQWNSLLNSRSFSDRCAGLPPPPPWVYVITLGGGAAAYDTASRRWRRPPPPPSLPDEIFVTVASAGSLVCLADVAQRRLFVTNPDYKILRLGCDGDHEIYDSREEIWAQPGRISDDVTRPIVLNFRSPAVAIGQTVHFMRKEPEGIVSYDAADGTWRQTGVPGPPHVGDAVIAECEGRVLLVGLQRRNAATCVSVWELQRMTLLWKEVDRMPNVWCLEFYGREVKMSCLGNRRVVMVALRSRQVSRLVTYDALTREWRRLPGRRKHWTGCGVSLQPCLAASP